MKGEYQMRQIHKLLERLRALNPCSKLSIKLGAALMGMFYIVGIVSWYSAPYVPNYFGAMALFRGCLEAGPACLAAGVCAGLLGDMMLKRAGGGNKKDE